MNNKIILRALLAAGVLGVSGLVFAHGDVTPQAVNTGLPALGEEWLDENPIARRASTTTSPCRSAPPLTTRTAPVAMAWKPFPAVSLRTCASWKPATTATRWYKERVINGAVRDGAVYMPRMADTLSQEALWAIRTYIESEAAKQ